MTVETLLRAIEERASDFLARGEAMDAAGVLPDDVVDWMFEHKIFKLCVPRALGGAELRITEAVRVYDALAAIDGNLGWQAHIGSGGGFFVQSFRPEVAERLFGHPRAVVAGSGAPKGQARPVPGGYVVSGRWRYASGAQYASVFTANCVLPDERIRAMAFLPEEVRLIEDWDALGMKATSGWSMEVEEVFVPEERSFVVGEMVWDPGYPLYRLPFDHFAVASIGAVVTGLTRAFFTETGLAGREEAEQYRQLFFTAVEQLEAAEAAGRLDEARKAHIGWMMRRAANRCREIVLQAMPHLGMRALWPHERVNRIIRDILTAGQHVALRSA